MRRGIMKEGWEYVAYCGLFCGLCAERARIPKQARALRETMAEEGWPDWGPTIPGFAEFWRFLESLSTKGGCLSCRAGGGPPECRIRACAQERGLDFCPQCPDYPCPRIGTLGKAYPTLIPDGLRLRKVGVEQWVAEQEERARRGIVYADLRCPVDGEELQEALGG
ncbi:MAG TPA: DUF3795 domain-containing protein [Candidatus Acetothermia bacterium]|nr:DUF3795 domain-containing protein [Candidatus Acetothermia bacterium]